MLVENKISSGVNNFLLKCIFDYDGVELADNKILLFCDGGMVLVEDDEIIVWDYPILDSDTFQELQNYLDDKRDKLKMIRPIENIIITLRER